MVKIGLAAVAIGAALAGASLAAAREPALPRGMRVDRAVLLMRHGVRPPTKAPPLPAGSARGAWPAWAVAPGYLTPHGRAALVELAAYDRATWIRQGLLPAAGCARVRVVADSDQRTIETGRAWAAALLPGCTVAFEHRPQDEPDPLFQPIASRAVAFDPAAGARAVLAAAGPGGIAAEERRLRPQLTRLDAILCGGMVEACGISREPSRLRPARADERPKLSGALDTASTAAQVLLLEYADGKPMAEVGWGRAMPADVERLSVFHATEFRLLARPVYVARANLVRLAPLMLDALFSPGAAPVTMISGHDTNVASLGGLLGAHWRVPGLATDDPAPGGAIVLQRLSDARGRRFVRALYRSQTVEQIRGLIGLSSQQPYVTVLAIRGCGTRPCPEALARQALGV